MSNDSTCLEVYSRFSKVFQFRPTATRIQIISPYINSTLDVSGIRDSFTQEDFNMRRKAKILQYNKHGTNNLPVNVFLMYWTSRIKLSLSSVIADPSRVLVDRKFTAHKISGRTRTAKNIILITVLWNCSWSSLLSFCESCILKRLGVWCTVTVLLSDVWYVPRGWCNTIKAFLVFHGFKQSTLDDCFFYKLYADATSIDITIHVDDGFVTTNTVLRLDSLLTALKEKFKIVKVTRGIRHEYLLMVLEFNKDSRTVGISMPKCRNMLTKSWISIL